MADYDKTVFEALISLHVPFKIALALASDDSPVAMASDIPEASDALVAANVAEIPDPAEATPEEIATQLNELIAALVDAGLMEEPA